MYTPEANNRLSHGWMHRYGHVKSGPQKTWYIRDSRGFNAEFQNIFGTVYTRTHFFWLMREKEKKNPHFLANSLFKSLFVLHLFRRESFMWVCGLFMVYNNVYMPVQRMTRGNPTPGLFPCLSGQNSSGILFLFIKGNKNQHFTTQECLRSVTSRSKI